MTKAEPQFLRVRNWEKFQHYKNRRPPWIKLHAELLDNFEFTQLSDISRAHLAGIWILASLTENRIPNNPTWIRKRICANSRVNLKPLIELGFLEVVKDSRRAPVASSPLAGALAERKQSAMPETETETETETEPPKPPAASPRRSRPDDLAEVERFWKEQNLKRDPAEFFYYWGARNWRGLKDWEMAARGWSRKPQYGPEAARSKPQSANADQYQRLEEEATARMRARGPGEPPR